MMERFAKLVSHVAVLMRPNVSTDLIISSQALHLDRSALPQHVFRSLRTDADGNVCPDFFLNQQRCSGAQILITGANFGCGSNRPAAVALMAVGLRCVIAESFSETFYDNSLSTGLLPIQLATTDIDSLVKLVEAENLVLAIDVENQVIAYSGGRELSFPLSRYQKELWFSGTDSLTLTVRQHQEIKAWQQTDQLRRPWIWQIKPTEN